MVRLYFSVCLDHIFFRYILDSVCSHPSSSGNTTMDYVSWQGSHWRISCWTTVFDYIALIMKRSLQIWLYVQQHRHFLYCLGICPNTLLVFPDLPSTIFYLKFCSSPLSFSLTSIISSSSFPTFLLSLPWSITSHSRYNSLFILLSQLFNSLFLLVLIVLGTSRHKSKNNCSQLGFI